MDHFLRHCWRGSKLVAVAVGDYPQRSATVLAQIVAAVVADQEWQRQVPLRDLYSRPSGLAWQKNPAKSSCCQEVDQESANELQIVINLFLLYNEHEISSS